MHQAMMLALASLAASALGQTTGLAGRVVQSNTRAPVSGVKVRAISEWQVTGPDGRFSFRDLAPGRYLVEVETEKYLRPSIGYAATLASGQMLGGIEIALTPLASVQGKVVDSEGMPVGFTAVKLIPKKGTRPGLAGSSGRDGSFKIERVAPGEYDLVVHYSRLLGARRVFRPTEARSVIVKAGAAVGGIAITVRWYAPRTVQGRVINSTAHCLPAEMGSTIVP